VRKNGPVMREHQLAADNDRQFSMRDSRRDLSILESWLARLRDDVFFLASEQAGLLLAQDSVNTAVVRTFLSLFAPVGRPLLWPHATPCWKSRDAIETPDGWTSGNGFDRGYQGRSARLVAIRTASEPAAAEDPKAEHAVPEYAPSLVAFVRLRWQSQ